MVNLSKINNLINLGNGLWVIGEEEFFNGIEGLKINVTTLMYENQFNMNKEQKKIEGKEFKSLIDNVISEESYIEPYILVIYDTENLIVRLECYDTFENEKICYEWEVGM